MLYLNQDMLFRFIDINVLIIELIMENKERLYIISFGNSVKYRMMYDGTKEELEKSPKMSALKNELADYIIKKVPMGSHACRFAQPEIHEVYREDEHKYDDYQDFNAVAVDDIKKVLLREVENMLDQKELDNNAQFGSPAIGLKE